MARVQRKLVPIDGDRVKAALAYRGLKQREAARRVAARLRPDVTKDDENSVLVSLNRIVTGRPGRGTSKRCERPLRTSLAKELGLPVQWLAGEMDHLPGSGPVHTRLLAPGEKYDPRSLPTASEIARYDVWQAIQPAFRKLHSPEASAEYFSVHNTLQNLRDPQVLRDALLGGASEGFPREMAKHLAAEEHLAQALVYVLEPAAKGLRPLNVQAIIALGQMLWGNRPYTPRTTGGRP